ncbi:TetR/AcrR family transcriptional regulator [Nocardia sp. NPDC050712]|uniref:TetR/AcrR family transcriptional regulator n=1 Tax=Nocardia sp. NPDC050712 TaxID=3155518 RepID=UPI0033D0FFE0
MHQTAAAFLAGTLGGEADEHADRTARRILDAAVLEMAATGMGKLKIDAVARRAGVNRATVYRRFGDLDGLLEAVTMREGRRMAATVAEAVAGHADHRERLAEAFVACLRMAREHPVISRTATLEPHLLLEAGMADDAALLSLGGAVVAEQLRAAQADGLAAHLDPDEAGRTVAMLFAACVLMPTKDGIDLRTDESVRAFAQRTLVPMIFGPETAARAVKGTPR